MDIFAEWRALTGELDAEDASGDPKFARLLEIEGRALRLKSETAEEMAALVLICSDWTRPGTSGLPPADNPHDVKLARIAHAVLDIPTWPLRSPPEAINCCALPSRGGARQRGWGSRLRGVGEKSRARSSTRLLLARHSEEFSYYTCQKVVPAAAERFAHQRHSRLTQQRCSEGSWLISAGRWSQPDPQKPPFERAAAR